MSWTSSNHGVGVFNPRAFSFGGTSAIVTSVGLIVGLGAATAAKATIVSGLLIVAIADNLTDSLSIHMYQEAEQLEEDAAFRTTVANFAMRLLVASTFVLITLAVPGGYTVIPTIAWGLLLLSALTYSLARARHVGPGREIVKHLAVATVVVAASYVIGTCLRQYAT